MFLDLQNFVKNFLVHDKNYNALNINKVSGVKLG